MIDIKSLIVGNLLSYNDSFCKVSSIFITHFRCVDIETGIDYGDSLRTNYKPIPLSEEILLKCGFEQVDIFAEYRKGSITLGLVIGGENQYQLMINGFCTSVILNSLHDLQNVYKIFEKQELEIKL